MTGMSELVDPCPPDALLDMARVVNELVERLFGDPDLSRELENDRLSWVVEGFDEYGIGSVGVVHKVTGQQVATARVHWRSLVA